MSRIISGIHHITAIAAHPQTCLDFYTQVLGQRLVKLTVNFDDPGTYHLYFGNEAGLPGSILTFFPFPGAHRGTVGNGQVSAITFAVPAGSLEYWADRLRQHHVPAEIIPARFGEHVLRFADPDGLPLELVATPRADPTRAWQQGTVAAEHAICGFHSATLSEEGYQETAELLADVMGLHFVGNENNRYRYAASTSANAASFAASGAASTASNAVRGAAPGTIVDVLCTPDARFGRPGAGTVHHIAWRAADDAQQIVWREDLVKAGYNVTPVMDRTYFHSIYYREPGGILFEIATDPPGFAVDESRDHLGEHLKLPKWLERDRAEIERTLPALNLRHAGPARI